VGLEAALQAEQAARASDAVTTLAVRLDSAAAVSDARAAAEQAQTLLQAEQQRRTADLEAAAAALAAVEAALAEERAAHRKTEDRHDQERREWDAQRQALLDEHAAAMRPLQGAGRRPGSLPRGAGCGARRRARCGSAGAGGPPGCARGSPRRRCGPSTKQPSLPPSARTTSALEFLQTRLEGALTRNNVTVAEATAAAEATVASQQRTHAAELERLALAHAEQLDARRRRAPLLRRSTQRPSHPCAMTTGRRRPQRQRRTQRHWWRCRRCSKPRRPRRRRRTRSTPPRCSSSARLTPTRWRRRRRRRRLWQPRVQAPCEGCEGSTGRP